MDKFTETLDKLRLFPRLFITVYIWMFYDVVQWFMSIPEPTNQQAGLVSIMGFAILDTEKFIRTALKMGKVGKFIAKVVLAMPARAIGPSNIF